MCVCVFSEGHALRPCITFVNGKFQFKCRLWWYNSRVQRINHGFPYNGRRSISRERSFYGEIRLTIFSIFFFFLHSMNYCKHTFPFPYCVLKFWVNFFKWHAIYIKPIMVNNARVCFFFFFYAHSRVSCDFIFSAWRYLNNNNIVYTSRIVFSVWITRHTATNHDRIQGAISYVSLLRADLVTVATRVY